MPIVATEIDSVHGAEGQDRLIFYRCQDHLGNWYPYGPVHADGAFDANAFKSVVAAKIDSVLAELEFNQIIGE